MTKHWSKRQHAWYQRSQYSNLFDSIAESANILLTLINDILDFSKIEAGQLVVEEYAFDLLETVESVAELLYPTACGKGVGLYVYILPFLSFVFISFLSKIIQ